jgi:hypothetical protein
MRQSIKNYSNKIYQVIYILIMAYGTIAGDFVKHYFPREKEMSFGNVVIGVVLIAICIGAILLVIFL